MTEFLRNSPVVRLVERLLTDDVSATVLAQTLGISLSDLDDFRSGQRRMPVEVRLRLTQLVLQRFPQHARAARQLKSVAEAELAFAKTTTVLHMVAPPPPFDS